MSSESPPLPDESPPRRRSWLGLALQLAGFAVGIALLGWCASRAFGPESQASLEHLRGASPGDVLALAALSAASVIVNGVLFWLTLLPTRRLGFSDVLATNAIATFLGYLPFKLGLVTRVAIHTRRDRVPLLTVGAWFTAVGVVLLTSLGPLMVLSLVRPRIDALWISVGLTFVIVSNVAVVLAARALDRVAQRVGVHRFIPPLPVPAFRGESRREKAEQLHRGLIMLSDPRIVAGGAALRLIDIGVLALRFMLAASILGQDLDYSAAVLVATVFFLISVVSPAGVLGVREAGVTGLAVVLELAGGDAFAMTALLVTAVEAVSNLVLAAAGAAWLRPDTWMFRTRQSNGDDQIT